MELIPGPPPDGWRRSISTTYDNVAAARDEMGEADWRWPIAERVLAIMMDEAKDTLLELGAGVGYTSQWFAERGIQVTATDLAPEQVALCGAKGLHAQVVDMYDLPFEAETFDVVWAMNCIHHVAAADFEAVIAGIRNVVRPGGLVYLGVWGGLDKEGMYENDFYQPARFFSLRSNDSLRAGIESSLCIEWFETFDPGDDARDDGLVMQSVLARRA